MMKRLFAILLIALAVALGATAIVAQEHAAPQATVSQESQPSGQQADEQRPENPNRAMGEQLAKESKEAAGEGGEAEFKESKSVKLLAKVTGLSVEWAYKLSILLNFLILAGLIWWFSKSSIPAALRNRSANIQKGIEEARKASEEAKARLSAVEGRLAKLDSEVAELRSAAEADFKQEEQRIRQSAEEDARRVVEAAEQEIAAAAKNARRELTAYAADLAVDLAAKKIQVNDSTDRALVSRFISQLGKDGK